MPAFRTACDVLPPAIHTLADQNFERLKTDPTHPSLRFKSVGRFSSVRVGLRYRVLSIQEGDDLIWFWIGSHADYDGFVG